ncbi:7216_t:CDS:2, partial [Cetraspora pellucida]
MSNLHIFGANNDHDSFISTDMNGNETFSDVFNDFNLQNNDDERVIESYESDMESEFKESTESKYTLAENQIFESWKSVNEEVIQKKKNGFGFCITRSEIDKVDKKPRRHVYSYTKGQKYVQHKEAHVLDERNKGHKTGGCPFHINVYRWKDNDQIRISNIIGTHNHEMVENITMVEPRYQQLTKNMQDEIRLLASSSVRAGAIIEILQKKYPEKYIHARNIYNMIQKIYCEKHISADILQNYPDSASYLKKQLYPCRKTWVLCFTHRSFNAGVQTTQRVESYNNVIKKHVSGALSLFELSNTIERLLIKEDQYQHFNEVAGVLPNVYNEDYYSRYFKAIYESSNLEDELKSQSTDDVSNGMFADDMFDAYVIELDQLINNLDHARIHNVACEVNIANEPAISTIINEQSESFEQDFQVDFAHLNNIRDNYVFTSKVRRYNELYEIHHRLANEMEMELILDRRSNISDNDTPQFNDTIQFAATISNPVNIHSKGRKPKNEKAIAFKDNKYKKQKVDNTNEIIYSETLNIHRDKLSEIMNMNVSHHCGVCGQAGHNSRTCHEHNN